MLRASRCHRATTHAPLTTTSPTSGDSLATSACAAATGIAIARLFLIGHDACHDALSPSSRFNHWVGQLCFLPSWHSFTAWKVRHNHIHHRHTNILEWDSAYPPMSPEQYQAAPALPFITMAALDLFPLIPTGVLRSQAQESTPRSRWNEVWLSRDGSLARSLGLPESEVPWVAVVAPDGRVVEIVHALLNDEVFARIMAALPAAPSRAAR